MLRTEFIEKLLYENESSTLDFKEKQYDFYGADDHSKGELLKDILAFTNAWRRADAYILVGVREVKGKRCEIVGVDHHLQDSDLQQFVNAKTQRPVSFSYTSLEFDGKQIGVIAIPIQQRPIYLANDFGKLKGSTVYIRRGSSTDIASPDEVAEMGADAVSERQVRKPILSIKFHTPENSMTSHIKVNSIENLDKAAVLNQLSSIRIDDQDLRLIERHKAKLDSITKRYPDGQIYHPYKTEEVMDFIKEVKEALHLASEDFEEFRKRANIFKRALYLYKPPWADGIHNRGQLPRYVFLNIFNDGTCPAHNVIVYIRTHEKLLFYEFDDLKQFAVVLYSAVPDRIQKIIDMAREMDNKPNTSADLLFGKSLRDLVYDPFSIDPSRNIFDILNKSPKDTMWVVDSHLKIEFAGPLMHHHGKQVTSSDIYLCPFLEKGESIDIEYECHANELPLPAKGLLNITAV